MSKPKREVAIINTRVYPSTNKILKEISHIRGQNIPRVIDELARAEFDRLQYEKESKLAAGQQG